jgi:exosortase
MTQPPSTSAAPSSAVEPGLLETARDKAIEFFRDLRRPEQRGPWITIAVLSAMLAYSYWPGLMNAQASWSNPQYSHGWMVPLFAVALIFWWRQPVQKVTPSARLTGLTILIGSFALRLLAARYRIVTIDMYTLVPALAGVFLLAGGWSMFRWAWAPIAFIIFMYPLPDEATRYLLGPLQTLATMVSTFALQTLGFDAYREGNQIILGDLHLGVVDACSGLRMLTIFVALSVALVLVGGREWWENLVILASAIPIALTVNAVRITVTGVMYTVNPEIAEKIFHDWAGYFMMPMALGMLFFIQFVLGILLIAEEQAPAVVGVRLGGGKPATRPIPSSQTIPASQAGAARRPAAPAKPPATPRPETHSTGQKRGP